MAKYRPKQKTNEQGSTEQIVFPIDSIDGLSTELANRVTTNTAQTITADKTFNGELKFGSTEVFQSCYFKKNLGVLSAGTAYANLDSKYKDGTWHRMWRLRFPNTSGKNNFWGKIKITLFGNYSSFNASGIMSKTITCNFNAANIYNNVGCYDGLGVNVEKDFRISEAIWNATANAWEILIWQKNLNGNNAPSIILECWTGNNQAYINAAKGITAQTVELTQDTTYTAQKASSTGGTKTVTWATTPVYENPLGEEIAAISDLPTNYVTTDTDQSITASKIFNCNELSMEAKDQLDFFLISGDGNQIFEVCDRNYKVVNEYGSGEITGAVIIDPDNRGTVPFEMGIDNAGIAGQVLTSQGADKTPTWTTPIAPPVKDVTVNGASVLDTTTGIAAISIKALECGFVDITETDSAWTDCVVNGTTYKAIRVEKTNATLGVFNSSKQQILVQEVYDDNYLYLCVGTAPIPCTIRVLNGNAVSGGRSASSSDSVLIEISSVRPMEVQTDTGTSVSSYNVNVRLLAGTLQVGDSIQLCKAVKKIKHNRDKITGQKTNIRAVRKFVAMIGYTTTISESDLVNTSKDIFTLTLDMTDETSVKELLRSYSNGSKTPLMIRVCRPKQIGNNKEISYIPISNSVKLGVNYTTQAIKPL